MSYTGPTAESQTVDLVLHAFEMTDEVDEKGYFVLRKHALVTFHFAAVHDASLERFDSDNTLFALDITRASDARAFRVELDSVIDKPGDFSATSGEIVSVVPCTSEGEASGQSLG